MLDDDSGATLAVGFAIETGGSFGELQQLEQAMSSAEGKIVAEAANIERVTGGMVNTTGATARITSFGNAYEREMQAAARSTNQVENATEGMIKRLSRQAETYGMTASQARLYRAEQQAIAAESRGLTEVATRLRAVANEMDNLEHQQVLVGTGLNNVGAGGKLAGHHMQNLAFQFQDLGVQMFAAAGSSNPLKMGFMALIQQGSQIGGIMSQAGVGIRAVGAAFLTMSKNILLATVTNPYLLALTATIGLFAGAVSLLNRAANDGADMEEYAKSLGLTAKEIRNLDNVTVTWGDTAKAVFQVAGRAIWDAIGPAVTNVWGTMKEWLAWLWTNGKAATNFLIGSWVGAFNAVKATWSMLPAAMGDAFYSAVNASIEAINSLIRSTVDGVNSFIAASNVVLGRFGLDLPALSAPMIGKVENQYAGALRSVGQVARTEMEKALGTDYLANAGGAIIAQARQNARDRIRQQAEEKGYLDPDSNSGSNKPDRHAEQLARENEAIEAQIRNLYALADAYGVSGAAALIAEARTKAESEAIKKRGDIELFVNRQIRLAIAQRVVDASKATAGMREQAEAQAMVNRWVADGIVPAARAAELVKDKIADLPLLAAIEAAQQRGLAAEAEKATKALSDQRKARDALADTERDARFNSDMAGAADQLATLKEELRLVGATNGERVHALAILKATQEATARNFSPEQGAEYVRVQAEIADQTERNAAAQREWNDALSFTADKWDIIASNVQTAAQGMADAFGHVGQAIGDMASIYANYNAARQRAEDAHTARLKAATTPEAQQMEMAKYMLATSTAQVGAFGDMAAAAKGFFKEGSDGYQALQKAEQVFRAVEFALSVRAMAQDAAETVSSIAKSGARAAAHAVEAVAKAIASLPFPANLAAGAATAAALAAIGLSVIGSFGGGGKKPEAANEGRGTVFGDPKAQSESIKNAIDLLHQVDTDMLVYSRRMAASLQSIESQIGGFASLLVRNSDSLNASTGVAEGFKANTIGSILGAIPLVGGILKSLFGSKTTVIGSGLSAGPQSLDSILNGGFDGSTYSDIQKKKKFFGLTTGTKYSTQYGALDPNLENQFTLILRSFNDAILAAAGPLGAATSEVQQRLNGFVLNIGKIDLKGLTGAEIEEKLSAIFGAAADSMARGAFPEIEQFQKVGEGAFETLVRVSSTLEAVTSTLDLLGTSAQSMGIVAKLGLADQFDSISALNDAVGAYFETFYSDAEQTAAKTAQLTSVFAGLGFTMPSTRTGYRQLVEAQDLNTAAGREAYAMLLKLAPAFAELQESLTGAKSAADILSERSDLERQLLELQGNTDALRQLDLAKLDASNRALQMQIWAIQDAKEAARAADELREAWTSVGDSIMDEVRRIRGLGDSTGANTFASLMGQFNAATAAARGGDIDAAKSLPQLSQALLTAAAEAATSRQELDRVRAQTAASLEATNGLIGALGAAQAATNASLLDAGAASQAGASSASDPVVDTLTARVDELVDELRQLRSENNAGHAATASNTGAIKRTLDNVTADTGGDAVKIAFAA